MRTVESNEVPGAASRGARGGTADGVGSLVELLRRRASAQPRRQAYSFLLDGESDEAHLSYGELDRMARAVGGWLQAAGARGERVLLLYPPGLDYVAAFFGCLYAGAVAVPAYPPRLNRNLERLQAVATDAQPAFALTTAQTLARIESMLEQLPELLALRWQATDHLPEGSARLWREPDVGAGTLAFLQYTSGSTSLPKGVMVSHGNLLHNQRLIQATFRQTEESVIVGWLPLYHDMGLIGNVLQPLYVGARCVLMSPVSFLQRPARWLNAISRYRATTSGGPNFAYDLCARKVTEAERAALDLSSWEVAFNGAEPVRPETLERFAQTFGACGFRAEAFSPCYGLAEATLLVTGKLGSGPPVVERFRPEALERHLSVRAEEGERGLWLAGSGRSLPEQRVLIVNPETLRECAPGAVGEIWVSGPSVAGGYWNRPEETERTFGARPAGGGGEFLRTGDLGFTREGELFVTGRLKDLIIIRGVNHYPQDIELTVERAHPDLRPGSGAAFAAEVGGEERLVVAQEVEPRRRPDPAGIIENVRQALALNHEVQPHAVVLLKAGSIPKTSSGKIQRAAARRAFLEGGLDVLAEWRESAPPAVPAKEAAAGPAVAGAWDTEEIERWLVSRFAATLRVEPSEIDVHAPLASYALDSLTAVELMHSIESNLGVVLPIVSFLQNQSIAQLAHDAHARLAAPPQLAAPLEPDSTTPEGVSVYPLSRGQQSLWFLYQLAPESTAYNISVVLRVRSDLRIPALRRAFQALVERHPSLRTTFAAPHGEPAQQVFDRLEVSFQEVNASTWEEAALEERLIEEAHYRFNLEQGPLLRVTLFTRAAREYIVLLAVHHIIADFWSLAVLTHELGLLYEAEVTGTPPALAPLQSDYHDYVRWQQRLLAGPEAERLWAYWREQLSGELPGLNLPTDRQRPPVQTYVGASHPFKLDAELTRGLKGLARAHGATLYMTLLAGFQALLCRYTGQKDVLVGSPTAGRSSARWAGVVGYFVNPLVMRADLSGDPTFAELLGRVRQTVLDAFEHQDYPFPMLVERLQPARDPSRSPLFQAMFVLQKAHLLDETGLASFALGETGARVELGGLALESIGLQQRVAQFDLTLLMVENDGELSASLQYNTDLFDASTVARMAAHLRTLLAAAAAQPSTRVADLPLLSEEERAQLLSGWNDTARPYPAACLHELFERQARRAPDALALVSGSGRLTYGELNERANRLAHHLRALGVGAESLVGVLMERSAEMVVSLLGVLKAGGAYVPLDPGYPAERLRFMLEDARVKVLLTDQRLLGMAGALSPGAAHVLPVDALREELARESGENPGGGAGADNLAYVIYTSGSTGRPKGVAINHASGSILAHWAKEVFDGEDFAGVLASTSICFDLSIYELFVPLAWGGSVILAENALQLPNLPAADSVTLINTVPSAMAELIRMGGVPASVRTVNLAGEPLQHGLVRDIYALGHVRGVYNLYGPTEDTTYSTFALIKQGEARAPSIGRPIANTQVYLLDERLAPAPAGVSGELYLGGAGLARGYLNRPELTAERFVPDPFSREGGARMYRTGDLARYRADGVLEYLGRIDNQVKLRGFRIELGEIEAALVGHPSVREAAVVARSEAGIGPRLVAYVVGEEGPGLSTSELRAHLRERLPDYMVPQAFVTLEALPLTPNGKVDRRSLPEPAREGAGGEYAAPRSATEEAVAGVFAEVLGLGRVGAHDDFFELGGHSLLATQAVSRIRQVFNVEVALKSLFERPTVAGLSEVVEAALAGGDAPAAPAIARVERGGELPLSFAQQRLWFMHKLEGGGAAYNVPAAVRLDGRLDLNAFERSLNEVVRRHEALRTSFAEADGRPVQVIAPTLTLSVPLVELEGLGQGEREREVRRLASEEARTPFDLADAPLLRVKLLRLDEESHVLLLTMHHIVSDGWSMGVLVAEVAALYGAYARGEESPLPELPIQYADYAAWQREWMTCEVLETHLAYWKEQLAGAPHALELPTDRPRPALQTHAGALHTFELSAELSDAVKGLSRREGVTPFMVLLAAFQVLLRRYTGQQDIVVGSPIANRNRGETESLIGCFINVLAMRTQLSGGPSFRELLGRVREAALGAYAHQDLPFELLVNEVQPERDLSHSPLFQVMFILQNAPGPTSELPGLTLSLLETDTGTSKFDLTLSVEQRAAGLRGTFEYNTDLFDASTVARMAAHFRTLLAAAVENQDVSVADLPLLSEEERAQLLLGWNDTARDYPAACLHELFEAQAARTPDAVALVSEREELTYAELNERAERLARRLRALGVGAESLVGILMERSAEMVVSLLAVLKAGGAYVPLDPSYPAERLRFMLEDARVKVLLTQERLRAAAEEMAAGTSIVAVDAGRVEAGREEGVPVVSGVGPESLAYVIYTSGSTGRPKGVQISHGALVNFLTTMRERPGLTRDDVLLAVTTLSFDIAGLELYLPLVVGARLVLASREVAADGGALLEWVQRFGVTAMQATPVTWRMLIEAGWRGERPLKVLCGGEALGEDLAAELVERSGSVWNLYGPTETTIWSTLQRLGGGSPVLIGRPIANTQVYLLDERLAPAPAGVSGELYLGGAGLARGYLNRPELTAERFVPDPFSREGGARMYRTGDLARYRADGVLEYLGRIDNQVKLRGFRIELGEIETALRSHPGVREAVAVIKGGGRSAGETDRRLVAYLVAAGAGELSTSELRAHLRERLPDYMVPQAFVTLERLPLTPNGKVDRRALPEPARARGTEAYVEPRGEVEEAVAGLFTEMLGVERVGAHDDFFELGGHSLLATQTVSRVRQLFGVELPLRSLFERPTVAGFSELIEGERRRASKPASPALRRLPREAHRVSLPPKGLAGLSEALKKQHR